MSAASPLSALLHRRSDKADVPENFRARLRTAREGNKAAVTPSMWDRCHPIAYVRAGDLVRTIARA
jgi:hypothetical protein